MADTYPVTLGISLLLLGLGLFLFTFLLTQVASRRRPSLKSVSPAPPPVSISAHQQAVLLIQSGGRVTYLNQQARELFNLPEEEPNLENLARRTRPSEAFLSLCASQGQTRFLLNGRMVEGVSYYVPADPKKGPESPHAILVTLHVPQIHLGGSSMPLPPRQELTGETPSPSEGAESLAGIFGIITELNRLVAANLGLEKTIQSILEGVENLLPSDVSEIVIWDEQEQLFTPYRLIGTPGVDRRIEKSPHRYPLEESYSGYLITHRQPLLIKDVSTFQEVVLNPDRQRYPLQSFLGVPLIVGDKPVGTLELASLHKANFSDSELEVLRLISSQASVALNNALLYEQEQRRVAELSGLANLAKTVTEAHELQDLFARLIECVAPIISAKVLGFLVFDETRGILYGQNPFVGIPANIVEWYQTVVPKGSKAEALINSAEIILSPNAPEDMRLQPLELDNLALMTGIRQMILTPLVSGGHTLGYLQVGDKLDGTPFNQEDMRLLTIIAGQAAPIIENATLVQQSRRRALRAETLRRIASLTNSSATLEEILKFSTLDLARLLQADSAALFLLDENRGELHLHRRSSFGIPPEIGIRIGRLAVEDPLFSRIATGSGQPFFANDLEVASEVPPFYQQFVDQLQVRSLISVPLMMGERSLGELIVGSVRPNAFTQGDVQTVTTAAGQLASAIERNTLSSQTDQSLRRRVEQLTALTRVSRELSASVDLENLLRRVSDEVLRTTRASCGTTLLFEIKDEHSNALRNAEADEALTLASRKILLYFGDAPSAELHPLEQLVLREGEAVIVDDFATVDFPPAHEDVRSAMVVPIAYQGRVAGLIHLHAHNPHHFQAAEREIAEALAIQAAIALGNAHRFREQLRRSESLNRRVEMLARLSEVTQTLRLEQPLEESLETIAYAIQSATPFDVVLISLYDPQTENLMRVAGAGLPLASLTELKSHPQPWKSIQVLLKPEFCQGLSYFIPSEHSPAMPADLHYLDLPLKQLPDEEFNWRTEDILIVPLFDSQGAPLGLISVDAPRNNLRPDRPAIEALEIFSTQAAIVIESQRKVQLLRTHVQKIQEELQLAQEAAQRSKSHLPVLLHKDLEQTLTIQHLSQQARRINAGLDIAEILNQQKSRSDVLFTLGRETLARMGFDEVLIAEPTPGGLSLTHMFGAIPAGVNPKALLGQRNPLRQCLQTGETMLVSNLESSPEWKNTPLLKSLEAVSFVCLPIGDLTNGSQAPQRAEGEATSAGQRFTPLAAMLAITTTPLASFTQDDEQLFSILARQVASALRNLNLQEETSRRLDEVNLLLDFSRQLGSLEPTSILRTLMDSALHLVPSAQSAMVALWDARQGVLVPQCASGYARIEELMEVHYRPGEGLPGQVFEQKRALRVDEVEFARHYNLSPENLRRYRNATAGRLPVSSLVVPIMSGVALGEGEDLSLAKDEAHLREETRTLPWGVLVLDSSQTTSAFTDDDLAILGSLTQQTALTLENARLYQASQRRSEQLQALTQASTAIATSLHPEELTGALLDQLNMILPYDTGTLWLRQKEPLLRPGQSPSDKMVIRDARGFEDNEQRIGLTVDVKDSLLLNEMISTGQPIWVPNVLNDPRFQAFSFQEVEVTGGTTGYERLSWLGVPIIVSGEVMGVIALEKTEANFYSADDIQVATTFASQSAVGLENARLYQESVQRAMELAQRSQTLSTLNRLSSALSGSLDVDQILNAALAEYTQLLHCESVSALLFEPGEDTRHAVGRLVLRAEFPQPSSWKDAPFGSGYILPNVPLLERLRQTRGLFSTTDISQETELEPMKEFLTQHRTRSLLIVPIISGGQIAGEEGQEPEFHGMLLAHNHQAHHFASDELELGRTICNQLAIAMQNARLYQETRSLTVDLERRVRQRTAELEQEHRRSETLLRIITELSASLDLDQVLNRTLRVLNEFVNAEQITILIARPGEQKLHRLASVGYTPQPPSEGSPTPLDIGQGLAGWIISHRQSVLIGDVLEDERWLDLPYEDKDLPTRPRHRSAIGVPLMSGAEVLGCLLLFHTQVAHFSEDQLELVQAAANQVAVAVNNAELYRLIRDQAEDLGNMLRVQQVETSRSKAILEAVADGVLVTDANREITLFNQSAEQILGLEREQVLGKTMEQFIGLFGRAGQRWLETISTWSHDPSTYQPGDVYSEQITLEDGRVILVHLAPVSLRNDFLGTVSIFQDITHQVEVDRLKSEFVATVSHELRTPMTSIKGYAEILLMGAAGTLNEQQRHFLQIVKSNTERLAALVNDLLDISQIEAGRIAPSFQPLKLTEIASQAIGDLQRRYKDSDKQVRVSVEAPPDLPQVLGDAERVRQVFDNLLDNAYQYNLPKGQILVRMQCLGDEVQVDVKDTGIGIHPDDQPRVFERFFRGENPLALGVSGTGLGLSIVQNIVQLHNGRIWLESSGIPGEGSTFSFTLPVIHTETEESDTDKTTWLES